MVGDRKKKDETGGACSTHGSDDTIVVGKLEGKRLFGRRRHRRTKVDLKEISVRV